MGKWWEEGWRRCEGAASDEIHLMEMHLIGSPPLRVLIEDLLQHS